MSCSNPLLAELDEERKAHIIGSLSDFVTFYNRFRSTRNFVVLPCGKCLSCQMLRSREWAIRCKHELSASDGVASFVTLTYDDEHLPLVDGVPSLDREHTQLFFKIFRKAISPVKVRFFGCGEYGSQTYRPHYHYILFGFCPSDLEISALSDKGYPVYTSESFSKYWKYGSVRFSDVCDETIDYVARYNIKKVTQDVSAFPVKPFTACSRRPGIGVGFFKEYKEDFVKKDGNSEIFFANVVKDGIVTSLPRTYLRQFEKNDPLLYEDIRSFRRDFAFSRPVTEEDLLRAADYDSVRSNVFVSNNMHYGRFSCGASNSNPPNYL